MRGHELLNHFWLIDCLDGLSKINSKTVNLILTSPPWDHTFSYGGHGKNWSFSKFKAVANEMSRVLKDDGAVCLDMADGRENGFCTGNTIRQANYMLTIGFKLFENLVIHTNTRMYPAGKNHGLSPEQVFVFSKGRPATVNRREKPNRPESVGARMRNYHQRSPNQANQDRYTGKIIGARGKRGAIWSYSPLGQCKCGLETEFSKMVFTTYPKFDEDSAVKQYFVGQKAGYLRAHPARMCPALVRDLIRTYSATGDVVMDPFAGTATTLAEAMLNYRSYVGFEVWPEAYELGQRRLKEASNTLMRRLARKKPDAKK